MQDYGHTTERSGRRLRGHYGSASRHESISSHDQGWKSERPILGRIEEATTWYVPRITNVPLIRFLARISQFSALNLHLQVKYRRVKDALDHSYVLAISVTCVCLVPIYQPIVGDIGGYIELLKGLKAGVDENTVPAICWKEVRPFLALEHFTVDIIQSKNSAAAGVCSFVLNIVMVSQASHMLHFQPVLFLT